MIFRYSVSLYGKKLQPKNVIPKVKGDFTLDDYFHPDDDIMDFFQPDVNTGKKYGCGEMTYLHPMKVACDDRLKEYEVEIVEFIQMNNKLFWDNDVEKLSVFLEVFYDGGQCNFSIFDRAKIKGLADCDVDLPISIYALDMENYLNWEKETQTNWENR